MSIESRSTIEVLGSGDAFHAESRAHTSYLITPAGGAPLLVDVGATTPLRLAQCGRDPAALEAILLTHFHGDHLLGLPVLLLRLQFVTGRTAPLTIAGPKGVENACRSILDAAYPGVRIGYDLRFTELSDGAVRLGGIGVEPGVVTHKAESLGYRLSFPSGRIAAISGDAAFDERLVDLIDGVDAAFVEVSMLRQPKERVSHESFEEIVSRREELRAERLFFTHLGDSVARRLRESGIGTPAWDGMTVEI